MGVDPVGADRLLHRGLRRCPRDWRRMNYYGRNKGVLVVFLAEMPTNPGGKVMKNKLVEQFTTQGDRLKAEG